MNIVAIITSLAIIFMGFAGGGGSSSGGGGYSGGSSSYSSSSYSSSSSSSDGSFTVSDAIIFIITVAVILGIIAIGSRKNYKDYNSTPEEKQIHEKAKQIFESYQNDWSDFNYENIKKYTTDHYYAHASLMLDLLKNLHRKNKVSKLKVSRVCLLQPVSEETSFPINIHITFVFSGLDEVISDDGQKLYSQYASGATETWNFVYDGKDLKLAGISQPTESAPHLIKSLASFADENQLYYSPDWGRYALPSRGLIFDKASMKIADINNHVIGKWSLRSAKESASQNSATPVKNDLLIQLYSYAPTPGQSTSSYYIVGQINVPKDYLGVIVKSRKFKSGNKPDKSYDKFEMEWGEFNDRYEVYAASRDALPAFELLNPKFMEFLYAKNPSYNLEVVDNVIYIYAGVRNVTEKDYEDMLEVLQKAYDELKM